MLLTHDLKKFFFGLLIFIVFSLSDFYFSGIGRLFDYFFLAGLCVYFSIVRLKAGNKLPSSTYLVLILFIWLFVGMLNQFILASLAILIGAGFVYFFFNRRDFSIDLKAIDQALKITIFINALVLVFQTLVYYRLGTFLDFHSMVGSIESRGFNEGLNYFRASGLFQEPNSYCTVMFCLLSLRILSFGSPSFVDWFGWATIMITQSLWGFGAALVLLWLMVGIKRFILLSILMGIVSYLLFALFTTSITPFFENSVTIMRILNITDDPSRQARYGSLDNIVIDPFLFSGHGIDVNNFQTIAANSFGFLLYCFGIFGIVLLVIWGSIIQKISFKPAFVIAFLFTTFPPFSYMYFWVWLGLLLAFKDVSKKVSIDHRVDR